MNSFKINYDVNNTFARTKRPPALIKYRKSRQSSGFLRKPDMPPCWRMPLPDLQVFYHSRSVCPRFWRASALLRNLIFSYI
jgi:hypothetical protein